MKTQETLKRIIVKVVVSKPVARSGSGLAGRLSRQKQLVKRSIKNEYQLQPAADRRQSLNIDKSKETREFLVLGFGLVVVVVFFDFVFS